MANMDNPADILDEETLLRRSSQESLSQIRNVNIWGFGFKDISIISQCKSLEVLSMAQNKIQEISPLASCKKLREVYLRSNEIAEILALSWLTCLTDLRILWLAKNPCAQHPLYKPFILRLCPNLENLDGEKISPTDFKLVSAISNSELDVLVTRAKRLIHGLDILRIPATTSGSLSSRPPTDRGNLCETEDPISNGSGALAMPTFVSRAHSTTSYNGITMDPRVQNDGSTGYARSSHILSPGTSSTSQIQSRGLSTTAIIRESIVGTSSNSHILAATLLLLRDLDDVGLEKVANTVRDIQTHRANRRVRQDPKID